MAKQAFKACFSLFMVLSLLVNYGVSTNSTKQHAPPTASESVNGEQNLSGQQLASSPSVNGDNNIPASPSSGVDNTSVAALNADPPAAEAEGSGIGVTVQENAALPPTVEAEGDDNSLTSPSPSVADDSALDTRDSDTSVTVPNADPPAAEAKGSVIGAVVQENTSLPPPAETEGDNNMLTSPSSSPPTISPSPSTDDNSVLDAGDMDSISQENTSVPLSNADPPATETIEEENNASQENPLFLSSPSPSPPPANIDTPAFETADDGGVTQEIQSPPSNTVPENTENEPQLNDYNSQPNSVVPAPSEAVSYPELDPTVQSTPSNGDTYGSAPTSNQHTVLPFNYSAEDEPVEPSEEEEDSWNRANGAVAGVLVGACFIGAGVSVYQKRKKDNARAQHQYECLSKKEEV